MANALSMEACSDFIMWRKLMSFVNEVYRVTGTFPENEEHGLTLGMRRNVLMTPKNIARSFTPRSDHDFVDSVQKAEESLAELESQLVESFVLRYVDESDFERLFGFSREVGMMIKALSNRRLVGMSA